MEELILAINGGSSSIKYALFASANPSMRIQSGEVERLGPVSFDSSVDQLIELLSSHSFLPHVRAIGHRVVHGGPNHFDPQIVTPELLTDLKAAVPFAPNHLPREIKLIEALTVRLPEVPQYVCFDTAFHRTMPSNRLPIPRRYHDAGIRRYGFHGLSFSFLMEELERRAGATVAKGKVILAHLGSGCSMAAVLNGRSVDTTMGFTPAGGMMMATRTGDLDPGVLIHLIRQDSFTADSLDRLVNRESGLLGVSGSTADMRDLISRSDTDCAARDSIDLFCTSARKQIGQLSTTLHGIETIVFSGGIGEHSPVIRERILHGLDYLGLTVDTVQNNTNAPIISRNGSPCTVYVIPTDEEQMIARTVCRMIVSHT